jgi:hypothetical protein
MYVIEILWWILLATLIVKFGSIMQFSDIDDVYDQRARGGAAAGGAAADSLAMGYVMTYYGSILSPLLLAQGLLRPRGWYIVLGCVGSVVIYAIDGEKSVLFTPVMMLAVHQLVRRRVITSLQTPVLATGLASAAGLLLATAPSDAESSFGLTLLVHRALGLPAIVFSQYYNLFSEMGYTWWSHVRGISWFVPPPPTLASDPNWPKLGFIVADRVLNAPNTNTNASLFAGDGAAAAGMFGVVIIGVACALWLHVVDRCARGWNRTFTVLCITPAALALTNCHLFTMLLSYGGFFFPLLFALYKPGPLNRIT